MALTLQHTPQPVHRAEEVDANRGFTQSQNLAYLTRRLVAEMAQREHRPLSLR
jgi:hypothetical protein